MPSYKLTTDKTWTDTMADLKETMRLWGVEHWTVEAGVKPQRAHVEGQTVEQRRVKLYFTKRGHDVELSMDRQLRAVDNLRVLYLALEDMRMIERRGLAPTIQSAYRQISGLPAVIGDQPSAAPAGTRSPYGVLGVSPDADMSVIDAAYRILAAKLHPDKPGGNEDAFKELRAAYDEIKRLREENT